LPAPQWAPVHAWHDHVSQKQADACGFLHETEYIAAATCLKHIVAQAAQCFHRAIIFDPSRPHPAGRVQVQRSLTPMRWSTGSHLLKTLPCLANAE
jgi:hypothetical protein